MKTKKKQKLKIEVIKKYSQDDLFNLIDLIESKGLELEVETIPIPGNKYKTYLCGYELGNGIMVEFMIDMEFEELKNYLNERGYNYYANEF